MTLLAATLALAGVGLALTHDVLLAQDDSSPRRWTPMDWLFSAVILALVLLARAVELRRRPAGESPMEREETLRRVLRADGEAAR